MKVGEGRLTQTIETGLITRQDQPVDLVQGNMFQTKS